MYRGYVKLWRKSLDKGWLKNSKLWWFWCWCLMKASYKEYDLIVGFQTVHLMPGDFMFGRKSAAKETFLSEQEIRTCLAFLVKEQNLTIKTTNKFSVISITNWNTYQSDESINNQQVNQPLTNKEPTTNHKQECKEQKNVKKEPIGIPDWIPREPWEGFIEMRKEIKKPLTGRAVSLAINKLEELRNTGNDPGKVLDQSTLGKWQSLYELKGGNGNGKNAGAYRTDIRGQQVPDETARLSAQYYARKAAEKSTGSDAGGTSHNNDTPDF